MYHLVYRFAKGIFLTALVLFFLGAFPAAALPPLPSPNPNSRLTDLSGQLQDVYLESMTSRLESYPFEVRAVFLPQTQGVNLAFYAEKLFRHWQMPEKSMLLAVALDRRKIGVHIGKALKAELKQAASSEINLPDKSSPSQQLAPASRSPEQDHLELLPGVVEDIAKSFNAKPPSSARPSLAPMKSSPPVENMVDSNVETGNPLESPRSTRSQNLLPIFLLLGFLLLSGLSAWVLRFWQRQKAQRDLIAKFSLEGQASFNQIETVYARLDGLFPQFHGYQGETHEKLKLFLKELSQLQNRYDQIFDSFEEQVQMLAQPQEQSEALDFFQSLEVDLEKGQALVQQAQTVLKNLTELKQKNTTQLAALQTQKNHFSQELHELRKLHPQLKLVRLSPLFQKHHEHLKQMELNNLRDPMRVEKELLDWQKELRKLERELQSLPHLWLQFNGDLRKRIDALQKRSESKALLTAQQNRLLQEVLQLHKSMMQAIEQGDLERINQLNEVFTLKLQGLEAQI
ncbi:MAG: TPM domain-containing protein [Candidatus Sericytochromatia bacterium]